MQYNIYHKYNTHDVIRKIVMSNAKLLPCSQIIIFDNSGSTWNEGDVNGRDGGRPMIEWERCVLATSICCWLPFPLEFFASGVVSTSQPSLLRRSNLCNQYSQPPIIRYSLFLALYAQVYLPLEEQSYIFFYNFALKLWFYEIMSDLCY